MAKETNRPQGDSVVVHVRYRLFERIDFSSYLFSKFIDFSRRNKYDFRVEQRLPPYAACAFF